MAYTELQVTSNYSFLRGASHVEELLAEARAQDYDSLGIADRNSVAGIARAHQRAAEIGIRLIAGARLDLADGTSCLIYPTDRAAWSRLTRLLTTGKGRAGKAACTLHESDLFEAAEGQIAILLADAPDEALATRLARAWEAFGDRAYLALTLHRRPSDAARIAALEAAGWRARVLSVVTGDVLYHVPQRRILADVLTCIREGCTIDTAGFRRERHADRHLRNPTEMARLFARHPEALQRSHLIAERIGFDLAQLRYQYPHEVGEDDTPAQALLERLTWEGASWRYPDGVPAKVCTQLRYELELIGNLGYAPYFLTVRNIVAFARREGILCQGRGSAANSAVCFVLGITEIDPAQSNLLFERFVSSERREPPDIDVDFEHERREAVIQWVYDTYGRDRAALASTVIRYRSRGAIREVGKALGVAEDVTAALAAQVWGWSEEGVDAEHAHALNLNLNDRRLRLAITLARELIGFPRHLSQHPGGFVLTHDPLDELVPIEPASMADRQVIEWDKDDIDHLRFMKVDVLGLGMLGCLRRAFDLMAEHRPEAPRSVSAIPPDDPDTYDMICRADTIGVFQIESRAQMSMLPRMKPRCLYDLVIEVAVVRPGPIQGDMVHPYLRRREGLEPVSFPTPELEHVLSKTLGVPLFQEQAMQIAIIAGGFTPGEADQLRRSMATFKVTGGVKKFRDRMVDGMLARGYTREFAEKLFHQIEGFGSYGFPESHAASFAILAYASSWLKCHHPDIFCAALLNAQPMGFYAPAQIVRDARQHGVEVRPVSVNASSWDCRLEPDGERCAVRLGMRMAKGLRAEEAERIVEARRTLYGSVGDVHRRSGVNAAALERLAEADGFACLGIDRRRALWEVRALEPADLPLFAAGARFDEPGTAIAPMRAGREVVEDYRSTGLTLRRHPVAFVRPRMPELLRAAELGRVRDGARVAVGGLVLVRQRPGSAHGVLFMTIEDETGNVNLIVWPDLFERQRALILSAGMIACHGRLQREGLVTHVVAQQLDDLSDLLREVGELDTPWSPPTGRGDEARHGGSPDAREGRSLPGIRVPTRDFR